jgi:hypothetical protein
VLQEDFVVARTIQLGYGSGARSHAVFGRQEQALQHFHAVLDDGVDRERHRGRPQPVRIPAARVPA